MPDDDVAGFLDCFDVGGKVGGDLVTAVAGDEGDFADFAVRIEEVKEWGQVGGGHGRANFDANGIGETAEEFDVRVARLTGTVAYPEKVSRGGVIS